MNFFNLFGTKNEKKVTETEEKGVMIDLQNYSGMRVEVTDFNGYFLFVAKIQGFWNDTAKLYQYSEFENSDENIPLHVRIRGYSDHERKAVYMEGNITSEPEHMWKVEELTVTKITNDRAFFRLNTDIDATVTMFSGLEIGEKPCKMLNISVGGACISSECRYHEGDKFLLKVQLLEDRPISTMYCQVLRIIEKEESKYEYGCKFLELTEEDQSKITQSIFAAQVAERRKKLETS
ncbi:MAG: PilZ domain-containing protein [Coprococcus sp.]|nr:PilZ domain-containing protein [Coprococcus sp.]